MKKFLISLGIIFFTIITFLIYNLTKSNYTEKKEITVINIENSEKTTISNNIEKTIYVFNFWASYCKPCIEELEYFNSLSKVPNLKFYSINLFDDKKITSKIKLKKTLNYSIYSSKDFEKSNSLPITLFLDKNLKILDKQIGAFASEDDLIKTINELKGGLKL